MGAYLIYTFASLAGLALPLALACAILGTGIIGMLLQQYAIRPLIKSEYSVLMITIAAAFFIQELVLSIYGPVDRNIKGFIDEKLTVFGVVDIDAQRILTLAVAAFLIILLWLFINRTKMGNAMMAVAQNRDGAVFVGINPTRIFLLCMFISACLAAVAGAFIAPTVGARPHMWEHPLVRCFAVVVLGGLGSLEGTILAALIIGYTEVIVSFTLSSYLSELVILGMFMTVLIVRPSGLMGRRSEV
eukprot:TRINITY_DN4372_c1_g5_i1.p2 TRINITY_DN4372_c1_g5~~TRINITY_DN4372_c1_g5_i1.p2  ORF type:complete len:265 (-),score=68.74 TRINITY_DN4372_c1_g5_i1:125-859(-)